MSTIEILKWKTNGHKSKYAHAFLVGDDGPAYDRRALCGRTVPAYFSVDSQSWWQVKQITCPACKKLARFHKIEGT